MANVTENGLLSFINSRTGMATGPRPASRPKLNPALLEQYSQLQEQAAKAKGTQGIAGNNGLVDYVNRIADVSVPKPKKLNAAQKVLSNKAVQTALMPLQIFDVPRRIVVSGAKELYDVASGDGGASLGDFGKQVKDPTFGVGDFVDTGSLTLDRALGFAGDVALDPTTYATLGAGKFAGLTGKLALVAELGAKGGGEDLLRRAGARGLAGLTDAERVANNLPRAGVYVMGGRLPSTGRVGGLLESGLAATNQSLAKSRVGTAFRNARIDEGTKEIAGSLRTGTFTGGLNARKIAGVLNARNVNAAVTGKTLAEVNQELAPIIEEIRKFGDTTELTHLLESGDLSNPALQNTRNWLNNTRQRLIDAGVPEDEIGFIPNYVPHVHTDYMFSILSKETPFAKSYREQTGVSVNELRAPSVAKSRGLFQPGIEYNIGGKVLKFQTGSIKEINEVFAREFPELAGKKVLREDLDALLTGYGAQISQGVGAKAGADSLVTFGDDIGRVTADAMVDVPDEAANKLIADALEKPAKQAAAETTALRSKVKAKYTEIGKTVQAFFNARKVALGAEQTALREEFDALFAAGAAQAKDLQSQLDDIEQFSLRAQKELDDAIAQNELPTVDAKGIATMVNADSPIMAEAASRVESAQYFVDQIAIMKEELQSVINDLDGIKLPKISDLPQEAQAALKKAGTIDVVADEATMRLANKSGKLKNSAAHVRKAYQQFLNRFTTSQKVVGTISPKLSRALNDLKLVDDELLRQSALFRDYMPRDLSRGAVGVKTARLEQLQANRTALLNELSDIRAAITRESRLPSDLEIGRMEELQLGISELEPDIEKLYFERDLAPDQDMLDGLVARREAIVSRIKENARKDMRAYLDDIPMDYETKVQISEAFQRHIDVHIKSAALKNRIINKTNQGDNTARSLAVEAVAAHMSLDVSTRQLRIVIDYTQRYKNVVAAIQRSSEEAVAQGLTPIKINKLHLESLVAKEVLLTEAKRLKGVRSDLFEILDTLAIERFNVEAGIVDEAVEAGNRSKKRIIAAGGVADLQARKRTVVDFLEVIQERRKQINAIRNAGKQKRNGERLSGVYDLDPRAADYAGDVADSYAEDYAGTFFTRSRVQQTRELAAQNEEDFKTIKFIIFGDVPDKEIEAFSLDLIYKEVMTNGKVDANKVENFLVKKFEVNTLDPKTGEVIKTRFNTPISQKSIKADLNAPAQIEDGQRFLDAQVKAVWEEIDNNTRIIRDLDSRASALGKQFSGDHLYDVSNATARIDIVEREVVQLEKEKRQIEQALPELEKERGAVFKLTQPMEYTDQSGMPTALQERLTRLKYDRQNEVNKLTREFEITDRVNPYVLSLSETTFGSIDNEIELLQELKKLFDDLGKFKGEKNRAFVRAEIDRHPMMQVRSSSGELEFIVAREQRLIKRMAEIDDIIYSHGAELNYLKGFSSAPKGSGGRNVVKADWQDILFGNGSVSQAKMNFKARTELEVLRAELERKLALPNADEVTAQLAAMDVAAKTARPAPIVNAEIKTVKAEIADLKKQLAVPKAEGVVAVVYNKSRSDIRRKIAKAEKQLATLNAEKGTRSAATREQRLLLEQQLADGVEPSAQAELAAAREMQNGLNGDILTANRRIEDAASQIENNNLLDNAVFDQKSRALREQKTAVEKELSGTANLAKGQVEAYNISKAKLDEQIQVVNDAMASQLAVPKLRDGTESVSNGQFLSEGRVWLDQAVALTDPVRYWSLVYGQDLTNAPADVIANLVREANITAADFVGAPNAADQFALLSLSPRSAERDALLVMIQEAQALEAQLTLASIKSGTFDVMIKSARSNGVGSVVKQQIMDGWTDIAKTGVAVPKEINDAMTRVLRLDRPDEWSKFWDSWNRYTDVFKAYATLSPRFHIRNGMSATFMNFADGVAYSDMKKGVDYWREFRNDPKGWLNKIPENERKLAEDAVSAVFGSGGGRYSDFQGNLSKLSNNRVVAKSRKVGTSVEGFVRMGMALDTIRAGGSVNEAVARITRVHFNYSQVSSLDDKVRKVIPFWTFMSRNIPLQVQQMWTKPRAYQIYNSFVRNFAGQPNGDVVPDYYGDQGAFRSPVGSGYIVPDLPFTKIRQDMQDIVSPTKLLASSNPLIKGPAEFISGKNFFTGAPNDSRMKELTGPMSALAPLFNMLGEGATGADGQNMATARSQQLLRALTPLLNTGERLSGTGSTDPATQMQNLLNFFVASPYKSIPQGAQEGDLYARERLLNELLSRQRQLGFTPSESR
jgi:hypothetical protein